MLPPAGRGTLALPVLPAPTWSPTHFKECVTHSLLTFDLPLPTFGDGHFPPPRRSGPVGSAPSLALTPNTQQTGSPSVELVPSPHTGKESHWGLPHRLSGTWGCQKLPRSPSEGEKPCSWNPPGPRGEEGAQPDPGGMQTPGGRAERRGGTRRLVLDGS